jgi:hypothetical protein
MAIFAGRRVTVMRDKMETWDEEAETREEKAETREEKAETREEKAETEEREREWKWRLAARVWVPRFLRPSQSRG